MDRQAFKLITWLLLLSITMGCSLIAVPRPTVTPLPTATPIPGWKKFEGRGVDLWLPASYDSIGLDQNLDSILEKARALGPDFERAAQILKENRSAIVFWGYDSDMSSVFQTNVNIGFEKATSAMTPDTYLDALVEKLPTRVRVVERGKLLLDHYQASWIVVIWSVSGREAKQIMYVIKDGGTFWMVNFTTDAQEFERRLPTFEQSARTFKAYPR